MLDAQSLLSDAVSVLEPGVPYVMGLPAECFGDDVDGRVGGQAALLDG